MNRSEHLLSCAAEECNEVAQRISKAQRFGLREIQPGQPYTNAERIVQEYVDLIGVMHMLIDEGVIYLPPLVNGELAAKRAKVEKFMAYAAEQGALDTTAPISATATAA